MTSKNYNHAWINCPLHSALNSTDTGLIHKDKSLIKINIKISLFGLQENSVIQKLLFECTFLLWWKERSVEEKVYCSQLNPCTLSNQLGNKRCCEPSFFLCGGREVLRAWRRDWWASLLANNLWSTPAADAQVGGCIVHEALKRDDDAVQEAF